MLSMETETTNAELDLSATLTIQSEKTLMDEKGFGPEEELPQEQHPQEGQSQEGEALPDGDQEGKPKKKGERNKELGRRGENAAAHFLVKRGYTILERNWTCFAGEADIIAEDDEALVFVEVKTRRNAEKGFPSEAVNHKKRRKYEKIALAYLQDHPTEEKAVRFDVIAVVPIAPNHALIKHHIAAFSVD